MLFIGFIGGDGVGKRGGIMGKKRRVYRSILGIPVWLITGLSLFILSSALYDFAVFDRSFMRYGIMIAAGIILAISVGLHFVPLNFISIQARRQMGG